MRSFFIFVASRDSVIIFRATLEVHCGSNEVIFSQAEQFNKI